MDKTGKDASSFKQDTKDDNRNNTLYFFMNVSSVNIDLLCYQRGRSLQTFPLWTGACRNINQNAVEDTAYSGTIFSLYQSNTHLRLSGRPLEGEEKKKGEDDIPTRCLLLFFGYCCLVV